MWQSSDDWKLIKTETNDTLFYIENISKNMTFTITEDNVVKLKPIKPSHKQFWKKIGDREGYFKLSNAGKVLTAITPNNLALKGGHFIS